MRSDLLKKTGDILLVLCILLPVPALAYDVTTGIDPGEIEQGSDAALSVNISGSAGSVEPSQVPDVRGLSIEYGGIQHSYRYVNGKSWRGVILNYTVTGLKTGTYVIPSFPVKIDGKDVYTQPVKLAVLRSISGRNGKTRGGERSIVTPVVEISKKRVYAGEALLLRYNLITGAGSNIQIEGFEEQPSAAGCIIKPVTENVSDDIVQNNGGDAIRRRLASYVVIPARTGSLNVGGGTLVAAAGDMSGFFPVSRPFRLGFDTRTVDVLPLPAAGKPAGFSGNVGSFTLDAQYPADPVKTFDEKKIVVTVRGSGNMVSLSQPVLQTPESMRLVVTRNSETIKPGRYTLEGEQQYTFTIIPSEAGTFQLGKITLSFFDPGSGTYRTASSAEVTFKVEPGGSAPQQNRNAPAPSGDGHGRGMYIIIIITLAASAIAVAGYLLFIRKKAGATATQHEQGEDEAGIPEKSPDETSPVERLRELAARGKSDEFLKEAYRQVEARLADDPAGRDSYLKLKDELSILRFGGATPGPGDMERIMTVLSSGGGL